MHHNIILFQYNSQFWINVPRNPVNILRLFWIIADLNFVHWPTFPKMKRTASTACYPNYVLLTPLSWAISSLADLRFDSSRGVLGICTEKRACLRGKHFDMINRCNLTSYLTHTTYCVSNILCWYCDECNEVPEHYLPRPNSPPQQKYLHQKRALKIVRSFNLRSLNFLNPKTHYVIIECIYT